MTDKPEATTYVVSVFEKPHWRTVLTTKDKAKALAMAKEFPSVSLSSSSCRTGTPATFRKHRSPLKPPATPDLANDNGKPEEHMAAATALAHGADDQEQSQEKRPSG